MQLEETSEKLTVTSDKLTRTTSDLKETKLDRDAHKFLVGELTQSEDTLYDTANHVSRLQGFKVLDFSFNIEIFLFSSPEHKVLRVSYCDRSLSVVRRRPSSVVRRP